MGEVQRVLDHLRNKYQVHMLPVSHAWIDGCIAWHKNLQNTNSNSGNASHKFDALLEFVSQQWLLADFRELQVKALPSNLQKSKLIKLPDNYVLQVLYVLNIGQPAYSQHLKITTNGNETNSDVSADKKIPSKWEPKGRRMLRLDLTDGSQTVQAVEYQAIPQLHLDLLPGCKILIKGPVECRRGIIMLTASNVQCLGGEVSDLAVSNAPENVLARIIGKEENPNPIYGNYTAQTAANATDVDGEDGEEFTVSGTKRIRTDDSQPPASKKSQKDRPYRAPLQQVQQPQRRSQPAQQPEDLFPDDDDDVFMMAVDHPPPNRAPPPARPPLRPQPADQFPDDDDEDLLMAAMSPVPRRLVEDLDIDSMHDSDEDKSLIIAAMPDRPMEVDEPPSLLVPGQSNHLVQMNSTVMPRHVDSRPVAQEPASRVPTSSAGRPAHVPPQATRPIVRPFEYLVNHLKKRTEGLAAETLCIKGYVSTISGKLETRNGKWSLGAVVNDGSAVLDIDFSPEILEGMIGRVQDLRSMMSRNEEGKRSANQALANAKQKLIQLNCLMYIQWPVNGKPVVFRLEEIERRHLEMLHVVDP